MLEIATQNSEANAFKATKINSQVQSQTLTETERRPVFRMITSERTAGSIPSWTKNPTAREETAQRLAEATATGTAFDSAMAYAEQNQEPYQEPFGFGDFLDVVNPLHHIPLVNKLYQGLTGDTIHPATQIAGGALYGGIVGVASSAANVAVEYETGKDMTGNLAAIVSDENITYRQHTWHNSADQELIKDFSDPKSSLPGTTLALVNLASETKNHSGFSAQKINSASIDSFGAVREPVTEIALSPWAK